MIGQRLDYGQPINWAHPLNRDLLARWKVLPNWQGTQWRDLCGRHHGTLTNGPTWGGALGRPGGYGAIAFDGVNDHVASTAPNIIFPSSTTVATIAAWIRVASAAEKRLASFLNTGGGSAFGVTIDRTAGRVSGMCRDAANGFVEVVGSTSIAAATWYFVCFTAVEGSGRIYLNGVSDGSSSALNAANTLGSFGTDSKWAFSYAGTGTFFNGLSDDLMLWRRQLSDDEVLNLYRLTQRPDDSTLSWIWRPIVKAPAGGATTRGHIIGAGIGGYIIGA